MELRLDHKDARHVGRSRIVTAAMVVAGTEQSAELSGDMGLDFLTPSDP